MHLEKLPGVSILRVTEDADLKGRPCTEMPPATSSHSSTAGGPSAVAGRPGSLWSPTGPPGCGQVSRASTGTSPMRQACRPLCSVWCTAGASKRHQGCSGQLSAAAGTSCFDVKSHWPPALCRLLLGSDLRQVFISSPVWHPNSRGLAVLVLRGSTRPPLGKAIALGGGPREGVGCWGRGLERFSLPRQGTGRGPGKDHEDGEAGYAGASGPLAGGGGRGAVVTKRSISM